MQIMVYLLEHCVVLLLEESFSLECLLAMRALQYMLLCPDKPCSTHPLHPSGKIIT